MPTLTPNYRISCRLQGGENSAATGRTLASINYASYPPASRSNFGENVLGDDLMARQQRTALVDAVERWAKNCPYICVSLNRSRRPDASISAPANDDLTRR
jgi:hypothetical protein